MIVDLGLIVIITGVVLAVVLIVLAVIAVVVLAPAVRRALAERAVTTESEADVDAAGAETQSAHDDRAEPPQR